MHNIGLIVAGALALAGSALGAGNCTNPAVRKEYRTLSVAEKVEFVRAIKVRSINFRYITLVSNLYYPPFL